MKSTLAFPGLGLLLLTSCGPRDTRLAKSMAGTWTTDRGRDVWTLSADGRFDQKWSDNEDRSVDYMGTWKVSGGDFIWTVTNRTVKNLNLADMPAIDGSSSHFRLIRVDDRLVFEFGGVTNEWIRKP